jgi:hypothetical protein
LGRIEAVDQDRLPRITAERHQLGAIAQPRSDRPQRGRGCP